MSKMCPNCKTMNDDSSGFCQNCGAELPEKGPNEGFMEKWNKQSTGAKAVIIIAGLCCIGLIAVVGLGAMVSPDKTTTSTAPTTNTTSSSTPATDTPSSASSVTSATAGQEQAAKMAQSYLNTMAFSRSGLIKQLKYEGFTQEEAEYGVEKTGADWNKQAAKKAQSYLDTMAFSRSGLIEQLEYEGFTSQQAEYGVQAVGL
jgi:hypothetical protein